MIPNWIKEWFLTSEAKCKNRIGILYRNDGEDPFNKEYYDKRILEVKEGWAKYQWRINKGAWYEETCTCYLMLVILEDYYKIDKGE